MGYLADSFAEFRISVGHRHAAEYYLGEFLRVLSKKDCAELETYDEDVARTLGIFRRDEDYELYRNRAVVDSYDFTVIGNLLNEAVVCDISGGSDLFEEFLRRLDASLSKPEYCATVIAKHLFHQVQTQQFVDEVEELLAEAQQAMHGRAEDEEDERLAPIATEAFQSFLVQMLPLDWQVYDHMLERSQI